MRGADQAAHRGLRTTWRRVVLAVRNDQPFRKSRPRRLGVIWRVFERGEHRRCLQTTDSHGLWRARRGGRGGRTDRPGRRTNRLRRRTYTRVIVVGTRLDLDLLVPFTRTFLGTVLKYYVAGRVL